MTAGREGALNRFLYFLTDSATVSLGLTKNVRAISPERQVP